MKLTVSFFERIKKTKNPDEFKEYRDDACPGLVLRRRKTSWRWEVRWAPGRAFPHERIDLGNDASLARKIHRRLAGVVQPFDLA